MMSVVPLGSLRCVSPHAPAEFIALSKPQRHFRMSLPRCTNKPARRELHVDIPAPPSVVHHRELILCLCLARTGGSLVESAILLHLVSRSSIRMGTAAQRILLLGWVESD